MTVAAVAAAAPAVAAGVAAWVLYVVHRDNHRCVCGDQRWQHYRLDGGSNCVGDGGHCDCWGFHRAARARARVWQGGRARTYTGDELRRRRLERGGQ